MPPKPAEDYFNFLAKVGLTKHYGSLDATLELIEITGFKSGQRVIDPSRESRGRFQGYGPGSMFKIISRLIKLILTDRSARSFYKNETSGLPGDTINYVGYGVYAGQKP